MILPFGGTTEGEAMNTHDTIELWLTLMACWFIIVIMTLAAN